MSTKIVHGQSLLKRGDQRSTQRFEDIERKLANNVKQNIELVRKVDDVNNEWLLKFERQNESSSLKIQELERRLERQNESSSLKIQELERRLERQNESSSLKIQELERRLERQNESSSLKIQELER